MKQKLKQAARKILNKLRNEELQIKLKKEKILKTGYEAFLKTGTTPEESYQTLIQLYCSTNGVYNEKFNDELKKINPPSIVNTTLEGVSGIYTVNDFAKTNDELNEKGYVSFDKKLGEDICERLRDFASKTHASTPPKYDSKILFNPENIQAEIYRFNMQDLVNNQDIQGLMIDPVLVNFARNYLGCEPIFDFPAMWWSAAYQKEASDEAAQRYHFDMDRVKWLKIFFYLNDVTMNNGPHCYIEGSHKVNAKPAELLQRGYARIPDEDLKKYYKPEAFKVLCGEAGSMFMGDTKCWHKGLLLKKGYRLVLELEYTSSLFGTNYPKMEVHNASKEFKDFCAVHKTFASHILIKN